MQPNHAFILDYLQQNTSKDARILDYGCGGGEIVHLGRQQGLELFGADPFYEGGSRKEEAAKHGYLGTTILEMKNDRVDFPDNHFDVVVSNQVLEHVEDIDVVLQEIQRVLKPGGTVLSLFPSREVWWENHCGIPFLHRFPKGSRLRVYYAFALRCIGFGYNTEGKTKMAWAKEFCTWLDRFTYYRTTHKIGTTFSRYYENYERIEVDYLGFRLQHSKSRFLAPYKPLARGKIARYLLGAFVRKRGGMICVATKGQSGDNTNAVNEKRDHKQAA